VDPDLNWAYTVSLILQGAPLELASLVWPVAIFVALLMLSAFFSGAEVALFSLDASLRDEMANEADAASVRVTRLLERPGALLITILILNTVVNVGAAILAAVVAHDLAVRFEWNPALTVFLEVIALTFVLLVVSEISPKLLASNHARAFSRRISRPLLLVHRLLLPVSRWTAQRMQTFNNKIQTTGSRLSADDVKTMAEIGEAHGSLQVAERDLIHSIVEFGETTAREIMVTRLDIVALSTESSLNDAIQTIRNSGHSRIPVFAGHLDNILGIVYAKDILPFLLVPEPPETMDWSKLVRPPIFVPLRKKLDDLLSDFQSRKTHIALVVDEYGGTAGLVTLEDILEEIVGEIQDEHDEIESAMCVELEDGTYRVEGRIDLDDLNKVLGLELDTDSFDFETLAGLVFNVAGAIPEKEDRVVFENLRMRVESVENNRIGQIILSIEPKNTAGDQEDRTDQG
jgi:magnesium and cobalt exporter, CNNM family